MAPNCTLKANLKRPYKLINKKRPGLAGLQKGLKANANKGRANPLPYLYLT